MTAIRQRGRPSLASLVTDLTLGALAALGQAPWNLWYLTVLAMALLCWRVAQAASARRAGWHAFAAGFGNFALAMSWIVEPFLVQPEIYGWMAPFALFLMAAGGALFWTVPGWLGARIAPGTSSAAMAFAGLMVLSDWVRGWIFTGLPWGLTGHIWIATPAGQSAAVFGSIGLSALTMLAAALPLIFWRGAARFPALPGAVLSVLLIATAWSYGMARLVQPLPADTDRQVRLIQPNATQALKWDPYWSDIFFRRLLDLSAARDSGPAPDAVIWPETAVNFLLDQSGTAPQDVAAFAGAPVVLGIQRSQDQRYYNSLTEFSDAGIGPVYDKFHLVPFGEYTPWGEVMARFGIRAFAAQQGNGYSPGTGPQVLQFSTLPPVQPLICYEAVFSRHLLSGENRPQWLLQITNDAWFGNLSGPWQHLAQARLRAIEAGLPLMRAANTGVSAVIDARGQVRATLGLNLAGRIDARLPGALPPTIWSRLGDLPAILLACALVILGFSRRRLTRTGA